MKSKVGILIGLLVTTALFTNSVFALPSSSYYEGKRTFSNVDELSGYVEFAVYDTEAYQDEFVGEDGFENPGDGQYVYAYQIFCDSSNADPFGSFAILGIGAGAIADSDDIGSTFDLTGEDIATTDQYFDEYTGDDPSKAVWEFNNGLLIADAHSQFLLISSDHDWTSGTVEIKRQIFPVPNPEPATIALLGLGSLILKRRRGTYLRKG